MPRLRAPLLLAALLAALLPACADRPLLHDLSEREANEVLVALDEGGLEASKARGEGRDAGWSVAVGPADEPRARRLLASRELPRPRPPGLGDVFGQGSVVPTPVEEHARWLQALAGELARTLEALEGVVEARVHLGLPEHDPLQPGIRQAPRAAVLLKCRPAACGALRGMEGSLRALVAGAAEGLTPEAVAVVIAAAAEPAPAPVPRGRSRVWLAFAALAALGAGVLAWLAWRGRRRPPRDA